MSSYGGAGWCSEPSRRINAARLFIRLIEGKTLPGKKLTAASRASTCTPTCPALPCCPAARTHRRCSSRAACMEVHVQGGKSPLVLDGRVAPGAPHP